VRPPSTFGAADLALIHPEVMCDFVPDRVRDNSLQLHPIPRHAFVRSLIDGDLIRHAESLAADGAAGERHTVIQPEQSGTWRLGLDYDRDVFDPSAKWSGNSPQCALDDFVELLRPQDYWVTLVARPSVSPRSHTNNGAFGLGEGQGMVKRRDCFAP